MRKSLQSDTTKPRVRNSPKSIVPKSIVLPHNNTCKGIEKSSESLNFF